MTTLERVEGMSLEDYEARFEEKGPFEIIEREIIEVGINKGLHAYVIMLLGRALTGFVLDRSLGVVFTEAPFVLSDTSNWVKGSRLPDLMFYQAERFAQYRITVPDWGDKPFILVPDLTVEVVSPTDRIEEVFRKVALYLKDGVRIVWVIDPKYRTVTQYRADSTQPVIFPENALLEGGELIPGFSMPVKGLFE